MSEEVKTVEETKDEVEMTYYKMQMLVGMASDAQRHILIYGLKETLLNKYIDDIIGKSLVKYTANSQVKKRRAFRRNNNQENDDNNISSIIAELNSKIEQACKKLKIEDSSPYKLDQDKYSDRIKDISTLTTSLDKDEFSKIMSKILQLDECYNKKQKWTTTTEDKEKGTETKTTINPPAECENITEEVFIGELYDRISSNKPVEISLDDNGNVTDENKLMDYIIYLSESSENHERRKFKYIIEYINQNIGVIEGLDKDIYGKIMQQLNSKNTLITEYTDDKLSVEEKFYLDNLAKQVVKKIEKDIKAIEQRRLEPEKEIEEEEENEVTVDPINEFKKKLNSSWIKDFLVASSIKKADAIAELSELTVEEYVKKIIPKSLLQDMEVSGIISYDNFAKKAIKIIEQKIVELKPELKSDIEIYGIEHEVCRKDICEQLGFPKLNLKAAIDEYQDKLNDDQKDDNVGDNSEGMINKDEDEENKEKEKEITLSESEIKKRIVETAIKGLKDIKDKTIEGVTITDDLKGEINGLPDKIEDEKTDEVYETTKSIINSLLSEIDWQLNKFGIIIDGSDNLPQDIKDDIIKAITSSTVTMELSRETELVTRINYLNGKIKKLDEYVQANTIEFNEEKYFFRNKEHRINLARAISAKCQNIMEKNVLEEFVKQIINGELLIEIMQQYIEQIDTELVSKEIIDTELDN